MNQGVLFNDDWHYHTVHQCWCFSGQLAGDLIMIACRSLDEQACSPSSEQVLDAEYAAEQWLQDNDPPAQGMVWLQ
ncbi:hypothetical protein SIN8267_01309 [Sinobacterium norvegicum]|uniref:Uncharacterized protein n=1 Tax=Sinobacterium norvegicum TaxID=1641715 RepID=A0ABM9ADF5_9GAMM|nr:hypothetical protein [Sinobacterium norvegicum]CAH0991207.1 hypothetical protein SIN8267_01309 [Sinobacterium norvegicum]